MSIRIALILGFALAVGGYVGVRIYGHQQYEAGYEARDIRATLERNKQNQEVFDEQQRLQAQRDEAELRFVNLKMATDGERDALAGVLERLRKQTRGVLSKRATPSAGGRVDGAGGDRSKARRVGKGCVCTCRSRWSPAHKKKKK